MLMVLATIVGYYLMTKQGHLQSSEVLGIGALASAAGAALAPIAGVSGPFAPIVFALPGLMAAAAQV